MKTDPNSPAFAKATKNPNLIGLTKREYFAAAALQGLLASGRDEIMAAEPAVQAADQLIAELGQASGKVKRPLDLDVLSRQTVIQIGETK
jgi:hypothetical protein